MKKLNPKAIIKPTLVLFIICLVIAALLAGTNLMTKDPIAQQAELKAQQARQTVMPDAAAFEQKTLGDTDAQCYAAADKDGRLVGYTFTTAAKGYGGDVQVMTGIDARSGEISGVAILSQSETPGLGANAVKPDFTGQYRQAVPEEGFDVIKNAQPKDGEIAAMTGATITSKAVTAAVNEAVRYYEEYLSSGAKGTGERSIEKGLLETVNNQTVKDGLGGEN